MPALKNSYSNMTGLFEEKMEVDSADTSRKLKRLRSSKIGNKKKKLKVDTEKEHSKSEQMPIEPSATIAEKITKVGVLDEFWL